MKGSIKTYLFPFLAFGVLFILLFLSQCTRNSNSFNHHGNDIDTLKVVTLYGPLSYFNYRGDLMGIEYENVRRFANDEGMELEIKPVNNINEIISELKSGRAHLAAYPVPSISEFNNEILHCGPIEISTQILIQRDSKNKIKDVTELIGKDIYVQKDSKYYYRIKNLNDEIGGGINIITIDNDTIDSEDLLKMVSLGEIDYAVADSNLASLYKNAYQNIDTTLKLSSEQAASWAVGKGLDSLAAKINRWENQTHSSETVRGIYKRYYDQNLKGLLDANLSYFKKLDFSKNKNISDYDHLFKKYAPLTGYDWELLAAIAFCESRFNPHVESRFGAYGLMQVMPSTAQSIGINPASLGIPDQNILAASRIISKLDQTLKERIPGKNERIKFVVAAYNSGLGHIYDAMTLAQKNGMDPHKWNGNVSITALMKSHPEYYNDPDVKHGYFRGRETVDFVDNVISIYHYLNSKLADS